MNKKQLIIGIILKSLLLVFGIIGQVSSPQNGGFMSAKKFLYYTNLSNLWTMAITTLFLVFDIILLINKHKLIIPQWLLTIRFVLVDGITLTFVVFTILLTPQLIMEGQVNYLLSISNFCVHTIVPLLAIIDWFCCRYQFKPSILTFLYGLIMPLAYMIFALVGSVTGLTFGENQKVPYFFFDYENNTWFKIGQGKFGTFYWILILTLFVVFMSYIFILIYKKIDQRKTKNISIYNE